MKRCSVRGYEVMSPDRFGRMMPGPPRLNGDLVLSAPSPRQAPPHLRDHLPMSQNSRSGPPSRRASKPAGAAPSDTSTPEEAPTRLQHLANQSAPQSAVSLTQQSTAVRRPLDSHTKYDAGLAPSASGRLPARRSRSQILSHIVSSVCSRTNRCSFPALHSAMHFEYMLKTPYQRFPTQSRVTVQTRMSCRWPPAVSSVRLRVDFNGA